MRRQSRVRRSSPIGEFRSINRERNNRIPSLNREDRAQARRRLDPVLQLAIDNHRLRRHLH